MTIEVRGSAPLLQVFDMPASLAFYRDLLGFQVVSTNQPAEPWDWVWLRLGDVDLMLNTAYEADARPPAPDPARLAVHQDVCIYIGCPDVDAAYAHPRARGVDVRPPTVASYGMKQLYLSDPDNYALCFQWPSG